MSAAAAGGARPDAEALVRRLASWAEARADVVGAAVVGSQARRDVPADAWSDIDLVLVTTAPERYLDDAGWAAELGEVCLTYREPTAVGAQEERRVLFADGRELDAVVLPAGLADAPPEKLAPFLPVARRGARILHDHTGLLARIVATAEGTAADEAPPTAAIFLPAVADYLHHVLLAARKLARGETFVAYATLGGHLAPRLVAMAAWHARATGGAAPWPAGRFAERWADPRLTAALPRVTAACRADDVAAALPAALELFGVLAAETADALGVAYPRNAHERVLALTEAALSAREFSAATDGGRGRA